VPENAHGLFCPRESWKKAMGRLAKLGTLAQWLRSPARLRCSFCGRNSDQVERLVAGPSVYICDECIKTCVAVLEQDGSSPSASR
jgi:hypothetical protein